MASSRQSAPKIYQADCLLPRRVASRHDRRARYAARAGSLSLRARPATRHDELSRTGLRARKGPASAVRTRLAECSPLLQRAAVLRKENSHNSGAPSFDRVGIACAGRETIGSAVRLGVLVKVRDVIQLIENDGWRQVRQKGSHRQFKHASKPGLVAIAGKPGDDLAPGTLNSVLKQASLR